MAVPALVLRDGPVLVVSPHFDDLALSCAALIDGPVRCTVLDVCTAGPVPAVVGEWDTRTGFPDSDAATLARRAEERAAFAGTNHELREVGLVDHQYGGGFDDDGRDRLTAAVRTWLDDAGPGATVVLPVGAGSEGPKPSFLARLRAKVQRDQTFPVHPDHVATRDLVVGLLAPRADVAVVLYEEYPYRTTRRGGDAARRVAARLGAGATAHEVDVRVDRAAKARRIRAYESQWRLLLPARTRRPGGLERHLPRTERYWTVERPHA